MLSPKYEVSTLNTIKIDSQNFTRGIQYPKLIKIQHDTKEKEVVTSIKQDKSLMLLHKPARHLPAKNSEDLDLNNIYSMETWQNNPRNTIRYCGTEILR